MNSRFWMLSVGALVVAGCATTNPSTGDFVYHILFTPARHIAESLDEGDLELASQIYEDQRAFFDADPAKHAPTVERLATELEAEYAAGLESARTRIAQVDWPAESSRWASVRAALDAARAQLDVIAEHEILMTAAHRPAAFDFITERMELLEGEVQTSAWDMFSQYPLAAAPNFFDAYPVALAPAAFHSQNPAALDRYASQASAGDLAEVFRIYADVLPGEVTSELGLRYYAAVLGENGRSEGADLGAILAAVFATRDAGLPLEAIPDAQIAMIDVTSRTLVAEGQLAFPVGIAVDLPIAAEAAELDAAFARPAAGTADVLIIVDVSAARADRDIRALEDTRSEFLGGYRPVRNPAYATAITDVNAATIALQRAVINRATYDPVGNLAVFAIIALAAAEVNAQTKLDEAVAELQETPETLPEPVYEPYTFRKATIDAAKEATVNYYVVDRLGGTYIKGSFDVRETQTFTVAYELRTDDRSHDRHMAETSREAEVVAFEDSGVEVPLSAILQQYVDRSGERLAVPDLVDLREDILEQKNLALADLEARTFGVVAGDDTRFASVVMVYNPGGSLGSGFFVRDDIVLTNFHVIEGAQFVEMKLFSGQETFGRVIAQDIRLDLALVQVQARGVPVRFFNEQNVQLGATVEAIGHPVGLAFSISRGVISALRDLESRFLPGGAPVLFLQTDAAINPGNSGGPLFLGDFVVAVNTWHMVAVDLESLSFSVHYSEVLEFMRDNEIEQR